MHDRFVYLRHAVREARPGSTPGSGSGSAPGSAPGDAGIGPSAVEQQAAGSAAWRIVRLAP
jgi:hypothetical protein